ncbi:MAG: gfo/Idh/MocA family oxidoreductase, partial [Rikenellaceae bacterium]|nr:gfo/Idh/MocA family oxidoreductase [Rikenellaceae bacterium]
MKKTKATLSRRDFIRTAGLATAGLMVAGPAAASALGAPSRGEKRRKKADTGSKLNLAAIGIGNRGADIIDAMYETGRVNIVALCDVDLDSQESAKTIAKFPKAKRFRDF